VLDATTLDLPSINYQVLIHLSFNQCHIPHHIHIYHIISCHSNHHSNFILFNPKQFQDYQYKVIITLLTSVFLNSITYTLSTISIIKYIQPNIINKFSNQYLTTQSHIFLSTISILINIMKYYQYPLITILNSITHTHIQHHVIHSHAISCISLHYYIVAFLFTLQISCNSSTSIHQHILFLQYSSQSHIPNHHHHRVNIKFDQT